MSNIEFSDDNNFYKEELMEFTVMNFGIELKDEEFEKIWKNSVEVKFLCDIVDKEFDKIWKNSVSSYSVKIKSLYVLIFFNYRNYMLSKVLSGELTVINKKSVLKKIEDYFEIEQTVEDNFNDLLSILNGRSFDYFIDRYFFLKEKVKYNIFYEIKIANALGLRMEYFPLRFLRCGSPKLSKLKTNTCYYPYYLMSIKEDLLEQVYEVRSIRKRRAIDKYKYTGNGIDDDYNYYKEKLMKFTMKNFGIELKVEEYDKIWEDSISYYSAINSVMIVVTDSASIIPDIYSVIFFNYRNYMLPKVLSGELTVINKKSVLKKIDGYYKVKSAVEDSFDDILSILNRRCFNYFINRYFFLKENVRYNIIYEIKIATILGLRMEYFPLRFPGWMWVERGRPKLFKLKTKPAYYPYYLMSLEEHYLEQIYRSSRMHTSDTVDMYRNSTVRGDAFWIGRTFIWFTIFMIVLQIIRLFVDGEWIWNW